MNLSQKIKFTFRFFLKRFREQGVLLVFLKSIKLLFNFKIKEFSSIKEKIYLDNVAISHDDIGQKVDRGGIAKIEFDLTKEKFIEFKEYSKLDYSVKLIAYYLPQFHPFKENDEWWGKGFTEWTNVGKAKPNFVGHYQPHCPIHLGYYDLRLPEVMTEQAKLAQNYGIYGFSFYFYWFAGKTLMEKPLQMLLENKSISINYCFTWANENWTRTWDGQESNVLIGQEHSLDDSINFIRYLSKYFVDERYIKIDDKPMLVIYRANIIPDLKIIQKIWREETKKLGFPGLYLVSAQSFGITNPLEFDFDASVEFPPHGVKSSEINQKLEITNNEYGGKIYDYGEVADNQILNDKIEYKLFKSAMLSWDNTSRRPNNGNTFYNFSLLKYKQWLEAIVNWTFYNTKLAKNEKFTFINAWNEWAEGTHLEPDQKYGYGYLDITKNVISNYESNLLDNLVDFSNAIKINDLAILVHVHYEDVWDNIEDFLLKSFALKKFDLFVTTTSNIAINKILKVFPGAYIEIVENRGRDILPFIYTLNYILNLKYKLICKLHTKKSLYREDGEVIRHRLLSSLIGSHEKVDFIYSEFVNNSNLGMVMSSDFSVKPTEKNMLYNKENVLNLCKIIGLNYEEEMFPAGSMFWARPEALNKLLQVEKSFFEVESGMTDGTTAHAIERIFCLIVKSEALTVKLI